MPADALRLEVLNIAFGFVLVTGGLALTLLPAFYRSGRNPALTIFGAGVAMSGLVTLAPLPSFRALAPLPPIVWDHMTPIGQYFQPVVAFRFVELYWGAGRFAAFRRIWQIHLPFAVIAAGLDIAAGTPAGSMGAHLVLTLIWMTVFALQLVGGGIRRNREDGAVIFGAAAVAVVLFHNILSAGGVLPWSIDLLPPATLIFVGCITHSLLVRAFRNERRLAAVEAELETARRFQQSLLPRTPPRVPGGGWAVRYKPMDAVGGDLYDFFPIDGERFGVLLADVTGHGIPAALIASMVKTGAASQTHAAERPADVLAGMNRYLYRQLDGNLVTAVYACVDLAARRVTLANAGHPRPLLLAGGGRSASEAGERGAALGLLPDERYAATDLSLAPGDRLVLYSDGLVEAKAPDGALFEVQRLRSALDGQAALPAETWADHVLEEVTRWVGKPDLALDDDLTLVVLDIPAGDTGAS